MKVSQIHTFQEQNLLKLSSAVSKSLKQHFGKGPGNCYASFYGSSLILYINKFVTPAEAVLVQNNRGVLAQSFRMAVMEHVAEEIKDKVDSLFNVRLDSHYSDWDFDSDRGIIVMVKDHLKTDFPHVDVSLIANLKEIIHHVGSMVHKVPTDLHVFKLNPKLYAIKCEGVMHQIEKTLYEKGQLDLLQQRSIEIKKNYQSHLALFEKAFGKRVEGLFMIWDYQNEKNYLFFSLQ